MIAAVTLRQLHLTQLVSRGHLQVELQTFWRGPLQQVRSVTRWPLLRARHAEQASDFYHRGRDLALDQVRQPQCGAGVPFPAVRMCRVATPTVPIGIMIPPEAVEHLRGAWDQRHFIGDRTQEFCGTRTNWTRRHRGPPNTHIRIGTSARLIAGSRRSVNNATPTRPRQPAAAGGHRAALRPYRP